MAVAAPPAPRRMPRGGPRALLRATTLATALAVVPAACAQPIGPPAAGAGAPPPAGATVAASAAGEVDRVEVPPGLADPEAGPQGSGAGPSGAALGKYLAARTAQYHNDIQAAAENYAAALAADPDNPLLMRRSYYYLAAAGRFDLAVAVAQRAVAAIPGDDFAPLLLATDAMRQDRPDRAAALLGELEPRGLNGLLQPLMAAWAILGTGDLDAALAALEPARRLSSARRLADLHAALMALLAGAPERAAPLVDAYLEAGPPDNVRALELLAMLQVRLGRVAEARDLLAAYAAAGPTPPSVMRLADRLGREGASAAPDLVETPRDGFAEALHYSGLMVNQGQGSDTAIVLMRLALAVKPDFSRARLAIAETLRRMERFAAANAELSRMDTADDPSLDYIVQLYMAENLENLDRIDEALARYDSLAADHPDQVEPLVDKGDLLRRAERFEAAAAAYGAAIDRMSEDDGLLWPVLYRRGIAHERAGQWDRAEADFLRALELEPNQPEVLNYLGYSWLDRGEHIERAVEMVQEAVRQRPNDGYIVDSLGWGYYLLGRYEAAVTELERAVELRPQDWTINDHLGDAYWRVGRRTEARFQWERALSLEPDPDTVDVITRKLSEGLPPAEPITREVRR
ncbi:tetratricopeptide repeat protein [Roseospira goensis]|uniref:Tetratricopeptide (TPR) repeat protein n=1 Tax=Roseospira goensis TaxID=391922 RepID=A0A7W6S356_9PROT|nr:tetratricopeptide repeat protein [Roseospira goensis]MBB4287530.1 tetratricopeptide (TPR) repeat protein [Roseospira goensis]